MSCLKMRTGSAMDDDWGPIPLSRLSHAGFCLRRAALLTNEHIWEESADTAKGRAEHERVHAQRIERRGENAKLYEFPVFSHTLGVAGKCDCIEAQTDARGCRIPSLCVYILLNINMERFGQNGSMRYSFAHRQCVWKKCFRPVFRRGRFTISR